MLSPTQEQNILELLHADNPDVKQITDSKSLERYIAYKIAEVANALSPAGALSAGSMSFDTAGRLDISQAESTGDYAIINNNLPLRMDTEVVGGGTQVYDSVKNSQQMNVFSNGDAAIFQSRQSHPYYAGRSQLPEVTTINLQPESGVIKRAGYFSSSIISPYDTDIDGIYLESSSGTVKLVVSKNGSPNAIEQALWAGYTSGINWSNFQLEAFDFLYLGGTSIAFYLMINGVKTLIYRHVHAGQFNDVILGHPAQPVRYEIRSIGGSGQLLAGCANVSSGGVITTGYGLPVSYDTGNNSISLTTTGIEYVVLLLRKTDPHVEFFPDKIAAACSGGATQLYRWRLLINPTISNGTPVYTETVPSFVEKAIGDGTMTIDPGTGYQVDAGVASARSSDTSGISRALRIGRSIAGVYDVMALGITPFGNGQDVASVVSGTII